MNLAELIAQHLKECGSEHCGACECGWDAEGDVGRGGFAHADHLASVINEQIWTLLDESPAASAQMLAWHAPRTTAALQQQKDN